MGEYFDISPLVSEKSAVFPGDREFKRSLSLAFPEDHLELSSFTTTAHIGAHADAPSHYIAGAQSIDERSLKYYLGPAQVVHLNHASHGRVGLRDWGSRDVLAPRVLVATNSFLDPDQWTDHFVALSPELIEFLNTKGVVTVGIDTPSVDPATSKGLEAHKMIAKLNMAVLEGLTLAQVPEGVYSLIALPLRLRGLEASPVRAILLKNFTDKEWV